MNQLNPEGGSGSVVAVENLIKCYGEVRAVDDISFRVMRGEVFGMLGPNGAGKTTTVEIIEGLRTADSGNVSVLGLDVSRVPAKIKQRIGVQLQAPSLLPLLSVQEMLGLFGRFYRTRLQIDHLLELLSLTESRKTLVRNLSGGQQQRLSVALALVNDPDIAFLDEPTTGLDPQARRGLWTVIEEMRAKGKTIFLTTHYMEEAERLCDRVAVIDHGKIIALNSPSALIDSYFEETAIQFEMEPAPLQEDLTGLKGATSVAIEGSEVIVYSVDIPATMAAILAFAGERGMRGGLRNLSVRRATLEDVFLKLTGRRIRE
ncbi:MAG: ABC transporter ATP-binding protein [Dehalococcoidia bacterium]|nr:ABC transporter ATP-binding protein [Dehalococcoidia bacterium]